ncbi:MAG: succinate dehydrogenase/fumarate reductase iron-sulfur subunit [Bdellovibrionales bacterium]|nr:succinate dehydrogenase/fumarate reductase iron-sulfur subunit [Bdellovibrionales bacterium]
MEFTLHVWRQKGPNEPGRLIAYRATDISPNMSFFEMLDKLNRELEESGEEPIAMAYDCLEGICGTCSLMINGIAHGPDRGVTTCQLHMRSFRDGEHITIEPFRARAFPIIRDLVVDRSAFDRIIQSGGFVSVNTGGVPDGNAIPVPKERSDRAMDAAECIGCGACVASCKNGSAMLFTAAKVSHLAELPQGEPERERRVLNMVEAMDEEGFGACTNQYECEAVCPKEISVRYIAKINREFLRASACRGK